MYVDALGATVDCVQTAKQTITIMQSFDNHYQVLPLISAAEASGQLGVGTLWNTLMQRLPTSLQLRMQQNLHLEKTPA